MAAGGVQQLRAPDLAGEPVRVPVAACAIEPAARAVAVRHVEESVFHGGMRAEPARDFLEGGNGEIRADFRVPDEL